MYRRNVSRGFIRSIYKGSVCMTWGISKDHIGLRSKVCGSILGGLYNKTRNPNGNFNSVLFINRWTNKKVKLDAKAVPILLC